MKGEINNENLFPGRINLEKVLKKAPIILGGAAAVVTIAGGILYGKKILDEIEKIKLFKKDEDYI